jgi:hypothetical protein
MAEIKVNITECWDGGIPWGGQIDATEKPAIISGSYGEGNVPTGGSSTSVTRIRFVTPPFLDKEVEVTLKVNSICTFFYEGSVSSCRMIISKEAYGFEEITSTFGTAAHDFNKNLEASSLCKPIKISGPGKVGGNGSFVASGIKMEPDTTYYLYFARIGSMDWGRYEGSSVEIKIQCPELQTLTKPTLTSTAKIVKPSQSITASWKASTPSGEGLSNSVLKY